MFAKSITIFPFGDISGKGQSKIWERKLDIPYLGDGFLIRIWGTKEGPTVSQCEAFDRLINNAELIRKDATARIIHFLTSSDIVPADIELSSSNVWAFLLPSLIEVHANNEYSLGIGKLGTNAISIGYDISWGEGFPLLQIGVLDGVIDEIYSE